MSDSSVTEPSGRSNGAINSSVDLVDSLDRHMSTAGGIDRAALLPGMYLGWCVRLGLVTQAFKAEHEQAVLRLNYGEGSGVELLVSCGGDLRFEWLTPQGGAFTRGYYSRYENDWVSVFGVDVYSVEDSWSNYDLLAPVLTRALYESAGTSCSERSSGSSGDKPSSRWKFWR